MTANTVPASKIRGQPLFLQDEWRLIYSALSIAKLQWQGMGVQTSDKDLTAITRKKVENAHSLMKKIEEFV